MHEWPVSLTDDRFKEWRHMLGSAVWPDINTTPNRSWGARLLRRYRRSRNLRPRPDELHRLGDYFNPISRKNIRSSRLIRMTTSFLGKSNAIGCIEPPR